jgi:Dullard-like phosphatase family protein
MMKSHSESSIKKNNFKSDIIKGIKKEKKIDPVRISVSTLKCSRSEPKLPGKKFPLISKTPTKFSNFNSTTTSSPTNFSSLIPRKKPRSAQTKITSIRLKNSHSKLINNLKVISQIVTNTEAKSKEYTYKDYLTQTLKSLRLIKTLPSVDIKQLKEKRVHIPRKKGYELKKTLILDLDETLVHCCSPIEKSETKIKISFPNGHTCEAGLNIRPYALECLNSLSKDFEIIIFTASHSAYADAVCDYLDPTGTLIYSRLYRDHCIIVNGVFIKDLRILSNRKLKDVVIIDNTIHCIAYQLDNCVPIISWFNDPEDQELLKIISYLGTLSESEDVRVVNKASFNLSGSHN